MNIIMMNEYYTYMCVLRAACPSRSSITIISRILHNMEQHERRPWLIGLRSEIDDDDGDAGEGGMMIFLKTNHQQQRTTTTKN